jgi:hypothetical protein
MDRMATRTTPDRTDRPSFRPEVPRIAYIPLVSTVPVNAVLLKELGRHALRVRQA